MGFAREGRWGSRGYGEVFIPWIVNYLSFWDCQDWAPELRLLPLAAQVPVLAA